MVEVTQVFKDNQMYMYTKDGTFLGGYDVGLQIWSNTPPEPEATLADWYGYNGKTKKKTVRTNG
jgi:hypothetical protein